MSLKLYLFTKNQHVFNPIFEQAGLNTDRQRHCCNIFLTNLYRIKAVNYLSNHKWYTEPYLYSLYPKFSYTPVTHVINKLKEHKFIKKSPTKIIHKSSPTKKEYSENVMPWIVSLPKLKKILDPLELDIIFKGTAAYTKKKKNKKKTKPTQKTYNDDHYTVKSIPNRNKSVELLIQHFNKQINSASFSLDHPNGTFNRYEKTKERAFFNPNLRYLRASFTNKYGAGGRMTGSFWQPMPKEVRTGLRIDREELIDFDFKSCYPAILYKKINEPLPENPYVFEKESKERKIAKKLFMILMNTNKAGSFKQTIQRISFAYHKKNEKIKAALLERIVNKLLSFHKPIEHLLFNKKKFLEVMFIESELMRTIIRYCLDHKVHFLPIHDGGICKKSDQEIIEQAFKNTGYLYTKKELVNASLQSSSK